MWQGTNWTKDASGQSVPHVHKYTELATGVCHRDGNGNYVDSSEAITLLPDGTAAATNCATQVYFPADIGTGVIRLVTSDGEVLQNGPSFLAFADGTNMVVIGTVTNSVGQLVSSNQVLYPDILHGAGFQADLLCTVRKGGYESDLVLREQIPGPTSVGLGTNARVELLTEFLDTPEPVQTTNAPGHTNDLPDVTLHFASAMIGAGKAFVIGSTNLGAASTNRFRGSVPVNKRWIHSGGQAFLVESVPYRHLVPQLRQLPAPKAAVVSAGRTWHTLTVADELPLRPRLQASKKGIQTAKADFTAKPGVVLDYQEISGSIGDYTFLADTTYLISGPTQAGTVTFQGGTVIKYGGGTYIELSDTVSPGAFDRPAVLTSDDDNSVGEPNLGGGGGANPALQFPYWDCNWSGLDNVRILNANVAIATPGPCELFTFTHCQFVNCGVVYYGTDSHGIYTEFDNCLMAYCGTVIVSQDYDELEDRHNLNNCTLDNCGQFVDNSDTSPYEWITSISSIFSDVGSWIATGDNFSTSSSDNVYYNSADPLPGDGDSHVTGTYPFKSGASANYYLADNTFRNIGGGFFSDDMQSMTAYAPQDGSYPDNDGHPDIGYHYPVNEDSDYDGLPDWWEWTYLGTFAFSGSDLDALSNTLLYDYRHNITPLFIVGQPLDQEVLEADTVTFTVRAVGPGTLTYQWTLGGQDIPNATDSSFTIPYVLADNEGDYAVTVSSGADSLPSRAAHLTVDEGTHDLFLQYVVGQRQDYQFKEGVTYYIADTVQLYGNTVLNPGAVIKVDWYYGDGSLQVMGSLKCNGTEYYPSIITSVDDDSVGHEVTDISSGEPFMLPGSPPFLDLRASTTNRINNLRIAYANVGVTTPTALKQLDIWDCQFLQCNSGIANQLDLDGGITGLHNALFANCDNAVLTGNRAIAISGEQISADVTQFWSGATPSAIVLKNSILTTSIGAAGQISKESVAENVSPESTFQAVDSGYYYLPENSPYRKVGATDISPQLLAELQHKTTSAPISIPANSTISGNLTLAPQAVRYAVGSPDMGYYYDAIDYTFVNFTSLGANITVLPGTTVGFRNWTNTWYSEFYDAWGMHLREGSTFTSEGTPERPITFVDVQFVQEQMAFPCHGFLGPAYVPNDAGTPPPSIDLRFCNSFANSFWYHIWAGLDEGNHRNLETPDSAVTWTMQDCWLHGGSVNLGQPGFSHQNDLYGSGSVTWINNCFDNVSVNLRPSYYEFNSTVNCDLSFSARNNLFRGNRWLIVYPIPASGGNWEFYDNLFDKSHILQDMTWPIDCDYNGYWPILPAEYIWGADAGQLAPQGADDQVLAASPPYQSGPLGDFYLPNTTLLYGAGSGTAVNLGLYHYTTRVDQMKEGDDTSASKPNVNIGLHYIATKGPNSTTPADYDGDGIPDYVENWHGDGMYLQHTDSETDWQHPKTDGSTPDAYSTIYNDIDLDGDGLTGMAEALLNTDPLTPDNPMELPALQIASGTVDIPLQLPTPSDYTSGFRVFLNGQESSAANIIENGGAKQLEIETATLPNGAYLVQLAYSCNSQVATDTGYGPMCLLIVSNPVTVADLSTVFEDTLHIEATVNIPADTYSVDIYDVYTYGSGNPLKTLTGPVQNGKISDSWDLTDGNGTVIASGPLFCTFTLSTDPITITYRQTKHITGKAFVVASAGLFFLNQEDIIENDVVNYLCPGDGGGENDYPLLPQNFNTPYSDNPFFWGDGLTKTILKDALSYSTAGDFYFLGHGNFESISDMKRPITPGDAIGVDEVKGWLGNNGRTVSPDTVTYLNNHAYRLVILDTCSSFSKDWAQAFGIPIFSARAKADYQTFGLDPCAFVGWTKDTSVGSISTDAGNAYGDCLQELFTDWYSGDALIFCLGAYTVVLEDPNSAQYHFTNQQLWDIAGCYDLTIYDQ